MPITIPKNLNLCFTKIKLPLTFQSSSPPPTPENRSRTLSSSAASATPSPLQFKNYNSLYDYKTSKSSPDSEPESEPEAEPSFATVFASQRFFFTSPGSSNSIVESTPSSSIATTLEPSGDGGNSDELMFEHNSSTCTAVKDSVAVQTFSPNPYVEFKRSMQEMVEARELIDVKANWDYLQELLLCYLALNPKSMHEFIIRAFADLLVTLMAVK